MYLCNLFTFECSSVSLNLSLNKVLKIHGVEGYVLWGKGWDFSPSETSRSGALVWLPGKMTPQFGIMRITES